MLCKCCGEDREGKYFRTRTIKGKLYYKRHKCKICLSPRGEYFIPKEEKFKKVNPLPIECEYLLRKIDIRNGEIDVIDSFKLASYYVDVFDIYNEEGMPPQKELEYMYNRLRNLSRSK